MRRILLAALLLAGCRSLPFPDPHLEGEYGKALKRWTRTVSVYSGLETRAFVRMVYLSPEFIAAQAVGGMTMGADPIASAVSLSSFLERPPGMPAFYVRKEPKAHGTAQWLEGKKAIPAGAAVAVVEDVVTTGASTLKAVDRVRSEGFRVLGVVALVDREEGGRGAVEGAGVALRVLFRRSDF